MKWWNLKKNKCPKCGKDLGRMFYDGRNSGSLIMCTCGFSISEKKYKKIVTKMVESDLEDEV
ncbi:MAG: hypothetical protein KAS32_04905 [Candidatus Peribacteraceae bacterium]|nr:hypothetical protein [Candidatus Peribacteraceae bacterium]